jgi:hypothetical protein
LSEIHDISPLVGISLLLGVYLACFYLAEMWEQEQRRFSLRTLLIAVTLVAIVLGLAAYVFRK